MSESLGMTYTLTYLACRQSPREDNTMGKTIRITVGDVTLAAELNDSATAKAILDVLPIQASGSRWGEEIYFSTSVDQEEDSDARPELEVGDLAYWPPGNSFCIFLDRHRRLTAIGPGPPAQSIRSGASSMMYLR